MARGRITELIQNVAGGIAENITQRQVFQSKKTEVMSTSGNTNVTWVMDGSGGGGPVQLETGSFIDGYKIVNILSENTGEATLLNAKRDNKDYVIKLYHKNKTPKREMIDLLSTIDNKYIIKSVDNGIYMERYYDVLPYYKNGDLIANMPIGEKDIEKIIVPCINRGLYALHEKEIIHRDIKPSNIFFSENKDYVVIGDFGISSVLNKDVSVRATSMSRTMGYSAPETSNGFISKESDYYSFGITLYHLVLGTDPFAGMSDMQILYQTINKRIELPQTISARIRNLITGLTLKDRNDRWGYEEVEKWIAGENVPVRIQSTPITAGKPYTFAKTSYDDLKSLSLAFAQDWENAKKHLYRGLVDKYLATFDAEAASQCMDLKEISDKDTAVFELIHLINPDAPLCYKGRLFSSVETLGDTMRESAPEVDNDIFEMIRNGCLVRYLEWNGFGQELVNSVYEAMQNLDGKYGLIQYFKLMYIFNPSLGFDVNSTHCEDLQDVIDYLEGLDQVIRDSIIEDLVENTFFIAWIDSQGYENQVNRWLEIYEKVEW